MKLQKRIAAVAAGIAAVLLLCGFAPAPEIKWVDFAASEWALRACLQTDIELRGKGGFSFADGVGYLAAKNGNRFSRKTDEAHLHALKKRLQEGENLDDLFPQNKYAQQLRASYRAVLGSMVGEYEQNGKRGYGLRCCFPLAAGYWFSHYDDFGSARSFGYKRKHLGHDIMGSLGTPIVATEGGTVTECGWNRYGGWRIGIRSDDNLRYWYYAHLRKDKPFAPGIAVGARVAAGDVIGYLGVTGYSNKENVNLKSCRPHLHFGLQLIFTPEQESGPKEIWVDLYALTRFLSSYRVQAPKNDQGEAEAKGQRLWI